MQAKLNVSSSALFTGKARPNLSITNISSFPTNLIGGGRGLSPSKPTFAASTKNITKPTANHHARINSVGLLAQIAVQTPKNPPIFSKSQSTKALGASFVELQQQKSDTMRQRQLDDIPLAPFLSNGFKVPVKSNMQKQGGDDGVTVEDYTQVQAICNLTKTQVDSDINQYISLNDLHYKHLSGQCLCFQCNCDKHKCEVGRNSAKTRPYQQPSQSIYKISYVKKQGVRGNPLDQRMYESMKTKTQAIDVDSVNHQDFKRPQSRNYTNPTLSFKPDLKWELNPLHVGRSHYKRDFLQWGCPPYQPIKAYSNRTTINEMPFFGGSTYSNDFQKLKGERSQIINQTTSFMNSSIPFLGTTTSKEFFQPYILGERVTQFKAQDELIIGAPSFKGQYQSLNQRDFVKFPSNCPIDISKAEKKTIKIKSSIL